MSRGESWLLEPELDRSLARLSAGRGVAGPDVIPKGGPSDDVIRPGPANDTRGRRASERSSLRLSTSFARESACSGHRRSAEKSIHGKAAEAPRQSWLALGRRLAPLAALCLESRGCSRQRRAWEAHS